MAYLVTLLGMAWLSFIERGHKSKFFFAVTLCLYASFIIGFRDIDVGTDTNNYHAIFSMVNNGDDWRGEILYIYLNQLVGLFTDNAVYVTFIVALITITNISWFIYKYSPSLAFSWLTFLGYFSFFGLTNIIRQNLAVSIVLLSIPFIFNRKLIPFLLVILVASLFHFSAIFAIPMYFMYKRRVPTFLILLCWLFSIAVAFTPSVAISVFKSLDFLLPGQYTHYITSDWLLNSGRAHNSGLGFIFYQLVGLLVFLGLFLQERRVDKLEDDGFQYNFFLLITVIYIILNNTFGLINGLERIYHNYYMVAVVGLPVAISVTFDPLGRRIIMFLLGLLFSYLFLSAINDGTTNGAFPFVLSFPF